MHAHKHSPVKLSGHGVQPPHVRCVRAPVLGSLKPKSCMAACGSMRIAVRFPLTPGCLIIDGLVGGPQVHVTPAVIQHARFSQPLPSVVACGYINRHALTSRMTYAAADVETKRSCVNFVYVFHCVPCQTVLWCNAPHHLLLFVLEARLAWVAIHQHSRVSSHPPCVVCSCHMNYSCAYVNPLRANTPCYQWSLPVCLKRHHGIQALLCFVSARTSHNCACCPWHPWQRAHARVVCCLSIALS